MANPTKEYNLEQRTLQFAQNVRLLVNKLARTITNTEDAHQVTRSSGSVGANYIEANECLSKKDFLMRIKISRKEAKESRYWLRLLDTETNKTETETINRLTQEATELTMILSSIMRKVQ